MRRPCQVLGCCIASIIVLASALPLAGDGSEELPANSPAHEELPIWNDDVATRYVGAERCVDCHQVEYRVWAATAHAASVFDLLRTSPNSRKYAANLGLDAEHVAQSPRCLACHSTPTNEREFEIGAVVGVTCEACHNAAGGQNGWLNRHGAYGPAGSQREEETAEHRQQRIAACRAAGQIRCDDLYQLAQRCYACHVIGDEELVVRGGHNPGDPGFEMVAWFNLGVRHNLFLDPESNAPVSSLWADPLWREDRTAGTAIYRRRVMYVVALLVDLELSLRNRGRAKHTSFATAAATRIAAVHIRLQEIAKGDSPALLARVVEQVNPLLPRLFTKPTRDDEQAFRDAASLVGRAARHIAAADEGARLAAVDAFLPKEPDAQTSR